MSLLAVDIGNTSTTLGFFDEQGTLRHRFDIPTRTLTHRALTHETLDAPLAPLGKPVTIGIASVVPWASDELIVVLHEIYPDATVLVISSSNLPLQIRYPHPEELGTDRLLGALAAFRLFGEREHRPCIVIDLGTATTYDCITSDGVFLGGAIAPGLELSAEALAQRASQLPSIALSFPDNVIGQTTVESMQSGVLFGGVAAIEGMIERLRQAAFPEERPIVIATGGLSKLIEGRTQAFTHVDPALVLEGIRIAAELSAEQASESEELVDTTNTIKL
ncbi:MAG: type III pantothenate kinase [Bacteroidota bacterium]|nr:type III pantothenate kinase [Bacteroidota bacterium]MDP4233718.1 type III pantothenate kinase [Bacteroidota bacterium]MDP4242357.1 type III pantothenate kinase [Bacteroidota bacterium]MDP4288690.1 type III pantothenate kinase [Bacteroidota bacterium]